MGYRNRKMNPALSHEIVLQLLRELLEALVSILSLTGSVIELLGFQERIERGLLGPLRANTA